MVMWLLFRLKGLTYNLSTFIFAVFWPRVFIMVVDAEQRPCESQDLAESDKHGVVYFAGRRQYETCNQETAAYQNQQYCRQELQRGLMFLKIHHNSVEIDG